MHGHTDILVVGSGLAGLIFALEVADHGHVTIVTKRETTDGSTSRAQGGIAAAWADDDTWQDHVEDTLVAGAGLCRREVVEATVREARERVQGLIERGVRFDLRSGHPDEYDLHREGGHSARRVLHAKDSTGVEIMRALVQQVQAHPNIEVLEHRVVVELLTEGWLARRAGDLSPTPDRVLGAYVLDTRDDRVEVCAAKIVALCTGGAGKVYLYTSNSDVSTGDGIAMAYRAGARVANMEFVQFHPTCLFHPEARTFLISEALRGEGGVLRLGNGEPFMARYDERAELAPRDIVARAIDAELKRTGHDSVFLDMTHMSRDELEGKFPRIFGRCHDLGIDISSQPIPVVPAAHYLCGGVTTDAVGQSDIENLYVLGEAACTGMHGANRLASNSLLEAVVFAHRAARVVVERLPGLQLPGELPEWDEGPAVEPDEQVVISQVWDEIRRFMWNYVGIVRTNRRLLRARQRVALVQEEIRRYYWDYRVTSDLVELRNIATVAELVVDCALMRRESRGLHFNLDYPEPNPRAIRDSVVRRLRW
ncbi:MAG: L-aspartate oxidase [Myxococcota bacterium]|nr:L-aspartate oxidase [Myxococcota bacterium]